MVLVPKLELRQGQQLVMTPQLQQAIRLLQLSNIELIAFVETELERNPLLEQVDVAPAPPEPEKPRHESEGEEEAESGWEPGEGSLANLAPAAKDDTWPGENTDGRNTGAQDVRDQTGWAALSPRTNNSYGDSPNLEEYVAAGQSLVDHLTEQLQLVVTDPAERLIGAHLIHMVDEAGYLQGDIGELATKIGAPAGFVEKVLAVMQTFDPPGVLARNLAESLTLQLKEQNRYDPQIARLLNNLELLGSHNLAALKRAVGVDGEELADMIAEIKQLNPKPGLKFGSVQIQPVLPDVLVRPARDGSWVVELNNDTLPRVLVNRNYYATVSKTARSAKDRGYLLECFQNANWLVKSLDQRARTILKVAGEIVKRQDGFLAHGVTHLRPLNLKTVAQAIGMHESTVSRVTSNKYMATPRGVFELKFFFTAALSATDGEGEAHSAESVRHRIRQMIEAERLAGDVHSDDAIVDILKEAGVDIARRTVAKYREAMRIPSSPERRRLLKRTA